ncbi:Uncharacterized protein YqjE [Geodia barretti]|uniref:Uncharacterized protein YqjE n=1 Tax=Geodia barretti TaxID=519541 RepID=A0AA35TZP2_GEOBA|nr:Uncharacterized protein YqjE [Geodia barretti]
MIDQERLVNSFCELVRIDSPSDEEEEVAQHLTGRLETLGFTVERDAHGNLIASEEGADPLMLSAHMDTVEPGRGIKPEVRGDRVVSDGTTILGGDCKAGVAAILEGLESIAQDGGLRRPVQVVMTRGEEIGLVGAANLDYSMIRCRDAVVFDGNGPVNTITGASPTYMRFDVDITGRGAHAGVEPEKGLSAIRIATEIINNLPQGRLDEETTFNVGLITGGTVRNAVPVEASFGGGGDIAEGAEKYRDATISEEIEMMFQMYLLDPNEAIVQLVTQQLRNMSMQPNIHPSGGGTDANAMRLNGVECVVVGMATNEMHTVNEYVVIPDILATAQFCQNILTINQRARA